MIIPMRLISWPGRGSACWPALAICVLFSATASGWQPVAVEGDRELLHFLRDTQLSNQGRFSRGRLTGTYINSAYQRIEGTIEWEGDKRRYECRVQSYDSALKQFQEPGRSSITLRSPSAIIQWIPQEKRVNKVFSASELPHLDQLRFLHPDDSWYWGDLRENSRLWHEMIDDRGTTELSRAIEKYVVQSNGDTVIVTRIMKIGIVSKLEFSLRQGGNLVRYRTEKDEQVPESFLEYGFNEWKEDGMGGFRLEHGYCYSAIGTEDRETNGRETEFFVTQFDPNPTFSPGRFDESSFRYPDGTKIQEVEYGPNFGSPIRQGEYYIGGPPAPDDLDTKLEKVSNLIRKERFAADKPLK